MSKVTIVILLFVLQTKSEAAGELEEFRKASEEERSAFPHFSPSSPFLICTSPPPVFSPPPVPQAHMILPRPPPPSVLPLGKPSTLAHPSANAPVNPALAREAILDAIRSGAAAEKLKKVRTTEDFFSAVQLSDETTMKRVDGNIARALSVKITSEATTLQISLAQNITHGF